MLEAKIIIGENIVASIASEFIENGGENAEIQERTREEKRNRTEKRRCSNT